MPSSFDGFNSVGAPVIMNSTPYLTFSPLPNELEHLTLARPRKRPDGGDRRRRRRPFLRRFGVANAPGGNSHESSTAIRATGTHSLSSETSHA